MVILISLLIVVILFSLLIELVQEALHLFSLFVELTQEAPQIRILSIHFVRLGRSVCNAATSLRKVAESVGKQDTLFLIDLDDEAHVVLLQEVFSEVGILTVVNVNTPSLLLQLLHNFNLLSQYRLSTRAHAEVNHTLVFFQLLLGLKRYDLVCKLATFEGYSDACRQIFLQFELELGNAVVKAAAVGQCF